MSYDQPVQTVRPGYSHRFDVFSPKLGRALTLYSQNQVDLWILLEVAPAVQGFCEHPVHLHSAAGRQKLLVDFSVPRQDYDELLLLVDTEPETDAYRVPESARLRYITRDALAQHAAYIENWRSMLPYVTTYRRWLKEVDLARAVALCDQPTPLAALERALSRDDPLWARTVVFAALAKGQLSAPSLMTRFWGNDLMVTRVKHGH